MWFRTRNRLYPDEAREAGASLDGPAPSGAALKSLSPFLFDESPHRQVPSTTLDPGRSRGLRAPGREAVESGRSGLERNLAIASGAASDIFSIYNVVRMRFLKSLETDSFRTVVITSPTRGSGNTLTAINLAINIARNSDRRVLLAELDLVTPSFHRFLGLEKSCGLADYLLDDAGLEEIVLDIGVDGLAIIPAGSPVANASGLLSSRKAARLLEELKRPDAHDVVLFDLPSVLAFDDAVAFSSLVDCALLVVEEGATRVADVRRARARLEHTRVLGVVLNRSVRGDDEFGGSRRVRES